MKTIEDFKKAAKEKNIAHWIIHNCSGCGYRCGFILDLDRDQLLYDNGCYCYMQPPRPRNWWDLADHYNMQESEEYIKEMDLFWGFEENSEKQGGL